MERPARRHEPCRPAATAAEIRDSVVAIVARQLGVTPKYLRPGVGLQEQLPLFAFGQNRKLRRVHAAQFHLIVHPNAPGLF